MKLHYGILFLSVFFTDMASAQPQIDVSKGDPYFIHSTDTVSKYCPDHITRDVAQDKKGNIWLATWMGIVRYDGKLFTNHTLKDGLIKFHVVCCYEDRKGNMWFGTARGGVYRYDGKAFKLFTTKDGLVDNNVARVFEDKNGNMWFGCETGASKYDGKTFTNYTSKQGLADNVQDIIQNKKGEILFGTGKGLFVYDGNAFVKKKGLPLERITGLLEDSKGNLWVGSFSGCIRYEGNKMINLLTGKLTYYFIEDKKGNVWFTYSESNSRYVDMPDQILYKYDGKSLKDMLHKDEPNDFQIFGKTIDREGNIWFGTMHGVCRYDGKSVKKFTR